MKIAHLADLHLGYRAYHRVNARGGNVREADVADAFRQAVNRIVELRPDLVLVAGDVFHTVRPSNTAIADAFRQFSLLADRLPDTPVVMIAGNHDSPRSADTGNILNLFREIDGVRVVCDECRTIRLPEIDTSILCLPHVSLSTGEEVAMEPDSASKHNVLMLHGTIEGETADKKLRYISEYGGAVIPEGKIDPAHWDYVALGHYHLAEDLAPNMWYAGGLERTSANIWFEREDKGFLVYSTRSGRAEFEAVQTRPMVDLPRIEANGLGAEELDETIRASVERIPDGLRGKIVRLVIHDVPRAVVRELNHKRIREWKAEAVHFHLDARPPEIRRRTGTNAPVRRQTLQEQVAAFIRKDWKLRDPKLDRDQLAEMGVTYVDRTAEEG
ncbi:exonuclease SbcCD subunit D [Longimicrobium sp.]|uniref:metallophosphoesterase family protein n=1 Tax=Longimicrobium sp. TaxID=2029185 RepID=UPI002E307BA2|nr:exonuclease SbcCD subunit D [Longimicrobium sp.]HEX6040091.1 exonuclease SbcCD subunit D [Longimicrobium sp.]